MSENENNKMSTSEALKDIVEVRFNNVNIYSEYEIQESLMAALTE